MQGATPGPATPPHPLSGVENFVEHFDRLEHVYRFLKRGGARAVAFFSDVESIEHQVFLTVAKELSAKPALAPAIGRANVGRGTSGCS
eukprot:3371889-Prymnesium_polylepis.1